MDADGKGSQRRSLSVCVSGEATVLATPGEKKRMFARPGRFLDKIKRETAYRPSPPGRNSAPRHWPLRSSAADLMRLLSLILAAAELTASLLTAPRPFYLVGMRLSICV